MNLLQSGVDQEARGLLYCWRPCRIWFKVENVTGNRCWIMKWRRRHTVIVIVSFFGLLIAAAAFLGARESEPRYHGRSLTEWVGIYQASEDGSPGSEAATSREAIRRIAADHLTELLQSLAYDPLPRQKRMAGVGRRTPFWLRRAGVLQPLVLDKAEFRANTSQLALQLLGPEALPAIPELTRLVSNNSPAVSHRAMCVLSHIGKEALPPLMMVITNGPTLNRLRALQYVAYLGTNALPAVPVLVETLNDVDPAIRRKAADALHQIAPQALESK
jgi:hypothetical protein